MYSVRLTIPDNVLIGVRESPLRARALFGVKVERQVQPRVQQEVSARLGRDPGPVSRPFEFATERSRRFYFWRFRGKIPYRRTGQMQGGWRVDFDRRLSSGQIIIRNAAPAAGWVYGPGNDLSNFRQVPGHRNTGWAKGFDADFAAIAQLTGVLMTDAWYESVYESFKR